MEFRKDINGLRAIAIIGVLFFHFDKTLLSGGFSGVDVFFVISGFLMTAIIFKGFDKGTFSIIQFYAARCKRIIPALVTLCLFMLLYGWVFIAPSNYKSLSINSISSIFFVSNFTYWSQASYFSADSSTNWLLHTWSLSVEWQFYLLYPLMIAIVNRLFGFSGAKKSLIFIFFISLATSVYMAEKIPTSAFFLLPARAWEMIAGGLVFLYPSKAGENTKNAMLFIGISIIMLSFLFLDESLAWPGYWALIPVLGAVLVIFSSKKENMITGNYLFQKIGNSSYSIYLWHWPVVVFLFNKSLLDNLSYVIVGIATSVFCGYISYVLIEKNSKNITLLYTLGAAVIASFFFFLVYHSYGADVEYRGIARNVKAVYPDQFSHSRYFNESLKKAYMEKCNYFDGRNMKNDIHKSCKQFKGSGGIFVWGDSHAQALGKGIRDAYPSVPFYQIATSSCRPGLDADPKFKGDLNKACKRSNKEAIALIAKVRPAVVVMAQIGRHEFNDYEAIAKAIKPLGVRHIIVAGPVPQYGVALPVVIAERHWDKGIKAFEDQSLMPNAIKSDRLLRERLMGSKDITYVSIISDLCSGNKCLAKVDDNNTPMVWDYGHLTPQGSDLVAKKVLKPVIDRMLITK